jgi:hypothetical protein
VVVCNIPRFYQFLGEIFAFVLLEMIEISQGFKTFLVYLKALLENYFKPSIIFLKNLFEKNLKSKYYFRTFNQLYASLLAKDCLQNRLYSIWVAFSKP